MHEKLTIIQYPDPRLKRVSPPVTAFDAGLADLAARMFDLMREARGVGLAAPQVGVNVRLFVMNHTGEPADDRAYVNPVLTDADGEDEDDEGCLSLPKITVPVIRSLSLRMRAQTLAGEPVEQVETGYVARIWQHETDHLNGVLLTDRMGPVAKLTNRKVLRDLEEKYADAHPPTKKRR